MAEDYTDSILRDRILPIRLAVFDVDGTLTDGSIAYGPGGEIKVFSVLDGAGLKFLMRSGVEVALITNRRSDAVERRAAELGIRNVIQGAQGKGEALEAIQKELSISPEQTASMGDDLPDLGLFARSGLRLTVPGAVDEVIEAADWVAARPAGAGAVREAAELILKAQGKWTRVVEEFTLPRD